MSWKFTKWLATGGNWKESQIRAFTLWLIISIPLAIIYCLWFHHYQCANGKSDRLKLWILYENECNQCSDTANVFSVENKGHVGILNNGTGDLKVNGYNQVTVENSIGQNHISDSIVDVILYRFPPEGEIPIYLIANRPAEQIKEMVVRRDELRWKLCQRGRLTQWYPYYGSGKLPATYIELDGKNITLVVP